MSIAKAHITWTATALGGSFGYYSVERYNELLTTNGASTPGWQRIAKITTEATASYDDYEGRYAVAEQYRVQVYDNLGGPSTPVSASTLTKTAANGLGYELVSNQNPSINIDVAPEYPLPIDLPERVSVNAIAGRYGQRLSRSTDVVGEVLHLKPVLTGATGAALWRTLVTNLRSNTLPYVCVLDWVGTRWFGGALPTAANLDFSAFGGLTLDIIEVTDTPAVVVV